MMTCSTCSNEMTRSQLRHSDICDRCKAENNRIENHPQLSKAILANRAQRKRSNERSY